MQNLQDARQDKSIWQEFEGSDPGHFVSGCFPVAFFKLDKTKDTFVKDKEALESVLGKDFLSKLEKKP